jgi:hypothetical protein
MGLHGLAIYHEIKYPQGGIRDGQLPGAVSIIEGHFLLIAECRSWIHPHRAPGGNETSYNRDRDEHNGDTREGRRVVRLNFPQLGGYESRQRDCGIGFNESTGRRDFSTNFSVKWLEKDMGLMIDSVAELGVPAPLTPVSRQLFREAIEKGYGEDDICGSIRVLEVLSGCQVSAPAAKKAQ